MSRRAVLILVALAGTALVWWASGLGRPSVDPTRYFEPEQIARANEYRNPRYWAILLATILNLAVLAVLAFTPLGDRLVRRSWPWGWAALATGALVPIVLALVRLPISFWLGYLHEQAWGFSTQTPWGWLSDWARSVGIAAAISGMIYLGLIAAIRWLPRAWPGAAGAAIAGAVVLFSFVWPVLVEPVFNDFRPMADRERRAELLSLAREAEVEVSEVLVADQSKRTTKENAYVSGFGSTKRIVIWDTLLDRASFEEVKLVTAHELGHRRFGHVEWGTGIGALASGLAVGVLWWLLRTPGVLAAARAMSPGDPRIIPLVILAATVMTFVTAPVGNRISRAFEERADRFALDLTGDRETYVAAQRGLALRNLGDLDPGPIAYRFLYTHPPAAERLSYAEPSSGSRNRATSPPIDPTS